MTTMEVVAGPHDFEVDMLDAPLHPNRRPGTFVNLDVRSRLGTYSADLTPTEARALGWALLEAAEEVGGQPQE